MSQLEKPILVFDSGVGGLSVLSEIRRACPQASIVYCADNAGFPYGVKTEEELSARIPALLGRLVERYRPLMAVIACNTASTIALANIRSVLNIPVVGTVPAIKPAAALSKSRVIGVLGTKATVRQAYVDKLVAEFAQDCSVLRFGSAELVELAEAKLRGGGAAISAYKAVMSGLLDQPEGGRMDTVVLACTHFPLVREELAHAAPQIMHWVDSGAGIARRVAFLSAEHRWVGSYRGVAVFTRPDPELEGLIPNLQSFGLTERDYL